MYAIEFETIPKDGFIQIPDKYKEMFDSLIKIIIIKEEHENRMKNEEKIKELIRKIQECEIFNTIEDPVKWQRKMRDDWEKSSFG